MASQRKKRRKTPKATVDIGGFRVAARGKLAIVLVLILIALSIGAGFYYWLHKSDQGSQVVNGNLNVETIQSQDLSIHFLELGNQYTGDCTLIKTGNTEILIDAGSKDTSIPTIKNYLDQYVTDGTLEYVIATHAHEDHIAGFATAENVDSLFDMYKVGTLIQFAKTDYDSTKGIYKNYCREVEELKERGTVVYNAQECITENNGAQKVYNLNTEKNVKLEILNQKYYREKASTENNYSVCCQIIQNDEKYYLFTGDLEAGGEASLVDLNDLHPVELFKAGHHGSYTSSSAKLMSVIQPKCVCVCCCAGSSQYNANAENTFPSQTFVNNVAPYTDQIYVTTLCEDFEKAQFTSMNGNIVAYCNRDDEKITVACSNNITILKNTAWFKANRTMPAAWAS